MNIMFILGHMTTPYEFPDIRARVKARTKTLEIAAERLGVSYVWAHAVFKGRVQPSPAMALRIEEITGGDVPRGELRPDIWPPVTDLDVSA